jgi:hypothetical protein
MTGAGPAEMAWRRPESNTTGGAEQRVPTAGRIAGTRRMPIQHCEMVRVVPGNVQAARWFGLPQTTSPRNRGSRAGNPCVEEFAGKEKCTRQLTTRATAKFEERYDRAANETRTNHEWCPPVDR